MGSPVSMIVCDAMMEDIEQKAIETAPHPTHWWYRYVDDTHTKQDSEYAQEFPDHLNTLDPDIKFTTEGEENGELAFLGTSTGFGIPDQVFAAAPIGPQFNGAGVIGADFRRRGCGRGRRYRADGNIYDCAA